MVVNHKLTERIYREEGLALRRKRRRKGAAGIRVEALDAWAYQRGIKPNFIRPGKPVENAFAESFNGRFRDECLNTNWFMSIKRAREVIESWRQDYNEVRPHSVLADT